MNGLLFITHQTAQYDTIQSAEIALKGGCRQIQMRMKDASVAEVAAVAARLKLLCDQYGAALYIDDHVEVCRTIGAAGVHLGQTDMSPVEARRLLGNRYVIGGTANTFEDICDLYKQQVDYIGLGPFRFTTTKKKLSPVLGLESYRTIMNQCRENKIQLPVLAIGGITFDDIPELLAADVSGIALSAAILHAEDPVAQTKAIVALLET